MNVRLVNVAHGTGMNKDRIFCQLEDAEKGDTIICADLPYVLQAIEDRGYRLVKTPQPVLVRFAA